ncbi:MAG: GlsB/YeaQ/YmgE family stress response membrane protein [Verrucomicrobiales bacterium]|nr:GlsB/YeaQ/YmgE family stress response membrane protein [Verrucomicrobiales bacterium]
MEWLITIAVGFVAGALGKFLMPGKDPGGCVITILLGIGGAIVGKYVAGLLDISSSDPANPFDPITLAISVAGVIIILLVYRLIFGKKK